MGRGGEGESRGVPGEPQWSKTKKKGENEEE